MARMAMIAMLAMLAMIAIIAITVASFLFASLVLCVLWISSCIRVLKGLSC